MAEFLKTESRLIQKKSDPEDAVNLDMNPLKYNVNDEYGFFTEWKKWETKKFTLMKKNIVKNLENILKYQNKICQPLFWKIFYVYVKFC